MDSSHKTHAAFGLLAGFVLLALFGAQLSGPGITLNRDRNWITDFGGVAADGADGSDDTAFAALIAARIAAQQYDAFLPPGVWNISAKVSLPAGFRLSGAGKSSIIAMADAMAEAAIGLHTDTYVGHLQIIGNTGGAVVGSRGIEANGGTTSDTWVAHWTAEEVYVSFVEEAFHLENTWVGEIYSPYVTSCTRGIRITGTTPEASQNHNVWGGEIHSCVNGVVVDASPSSNLNFWGMVIENCSAHGILLGESTAGIRGVNIKGCYFEANAIADVASTGATEGLVNLTAEDNFHLNFGTAYLLPRCTYGRIQGNHFQVTTLTTQRAITLGVSARYVHVGANRYRPTGTMFFEPATDDTGSQNTWDNSSRPFFALGDGVTDDTNALKAWVAANPKECVLPTGVFVVDETLVLGTDQILRGEGMTRSIIKAASGFAGPVVTVGFRSQVRDIGVQGVSGTTCIANGGPADDVILDRVQMRSGAIGLLIDNECQNWVVRDCLTRLNTLHGAKITSASGVANRINFESSQFSDNGIGIEVTGASRLINLNGCSFFGNDTYGYYTSAAVNGGVIHGCRFSDNGTADIRLAASSRGYHVAGNRFDTTPESLLLACLESTFENNVFNPGGGATTVTLGTSIDCEFGINRATTGTAPGPALVTDTRNTYLGKYYGNVAPAAGTWLTGDVVWDISPTSAAASYQQCSAGGSPGTWLPGPSLP